MQDTSRRVLAVGAAMLGAVSVAVAEMVMRAGRPVAGSLENDVLRYFAAHSPGIRAGAVLSSAGVAALVIAAVLVRPRFGRGPGRAFLVGMATFGSLLAGSALVAWLVARAVEHGAITAVSALDHWELERALFDAASILLIAPMIAAAVGLDRDRPHGTALTVVGVVLGASLLVPLAPWNFFAAIAWMVAATTFAAQPERSGQEVPQPQIDVLPPMAA